MGKGNSAAFRSISNHQKRGMENGKNSAAFRSIPYFPFPIIKKRELKCDTGKDNR